MYVDGVALTLGIIFLLLFLLGFSQLLQVLRSNDSNLSLRNAIVLLLTGSAMLRSFFWLKSAFPLSISNQALMIIYFLPIWLDFSGLSGLAVFYANIVNSTGPYKRYPSVVSFFFNFVFLIIDLAISSMLDDPNTSDRTKAFVSSFYQIYSIFLDFLLSILLLYFGYQFRQVGEQKISYMLPRSFQTFLYVNWLLVTCYAVRGVCNCFFYANEVLPASMRYVYFSKSHPQTPISVFLFFLFLEIIPNTCVIMLLWKVSESNSRYNVSYAYENFKNDLFNTNSSYTDSRDLLLSSDNQSPVFSNNSDDFVESAFDPTGIISNNSGDKGSFHSKLEISNGISRGSYSAPNITANSSGSCYNSDRDAAMNNMNPMIVSNNNTPNTSGHQMSPVRSAALNSEERTKKFHYSSDIGGGSLVDNSPPITATSLNITSSSLHSVGSPHNNKSPGSPGSASDNSMIWRHIQSNLGRQDSKASSEENTSQTNSHAGLLAQVISGDKITSSILYNDSNGNSNSNGDDNGPEAAAGQSGDNNQSSDSLSGGGGSATSSSGGKASSKTRSPKRQAKEKYGNTISPRDILLMSIKEDA